MTDYILSGDVSLTPFSGAGISNIATQIFTANGSYTPNTDMVFCFVKVKGAGAGGGGCEGGGVMVGGGGGEGGTTWSYFSKTQIETSQTIVVGIGGLGGNSSVNGVSGSTTTFGSILTANGGSGGEPGTSANVIFSGSRGGLGGGSSGGVENLFGQSGGFAWPQSVGYMMHGAVGGGLGGGPEQWQFFSNGNPAFNPGCGGGGGKSDNGQPAVLGGAGANGFVYIIEFLK